MTALRGRPGPQNLTFAIPADWFAIDLPRDRADAVQLAGEITAAHPELASLRPALERMIGDLAGLCGVLDVLGAYATVLDIPGGPLPATLVTSVHPIGAQTLDDIAGELSASDDQAGPADVRVFDLPAGSMVRVERFRAWAAPSRDSRPGSLAVQYVAEIPGAAGTVLLSFATPALALAGQLRQLFHQIACTVHFDGPDQPSGEPGQRPDGPEQPR